MTIKERIIDLVRDKRTQLPTLPVVVTNILKITSSEETSITDVADFINKDQAIANKVLRLANSAYYNFSREVDSIHRAIVVIGFNEIVSMAIGMGVFTTMSSMNTHGLLSMHSLWLHAIGSTFAAKEVVSKVRSSRPSESRFAPSQKPKNEHVMLSSLLHDMGKVLFAVYLPNEYGLVLKETQTRRVPLNQVEKEVLGIDHGAMAGVVMEKWNFPTKISIPVLYHHHSQTCSEPYRSDANAVELGNLICHMAEIGHSGNAAPKYSIAVRENLNLTLDDIKKMVAKVRQQRRDIEQFLTAIS